MRQKIFFVHVGCLFALNLVGVGSAQENVIVPLGGKSHGAGSLGSGQWEYLFTAGPKDAVRPVATDPFANDEGVDFSNWYGLEFDTEQSLTTDGRTLSWEMGESPFGFGNRREGIGTQWSVPLSGERDATHYLRYEFTTDQEFENLHLIGEVDDGVIIYLDGEPITTFSSCCRRPDNTNFDPLSSEIPYRTRATVSNGPTRIEGVFHVESLGPEFTLSAGTHVLAASLHSISLNSADMHFDLGLASYSQPDIACDFDGNGACDIVDMDALLYTAEVSGESRFDLDGSSWVDLGDRDAYLRLIGSLPGDTNLDGVIDASDLNIVGANWQREARSWSNGDFNGDGLVDGADLNEVGLWWRKTAADFAAATGPGAGPLTASVPEPNALSLLFIGFVSIFVCRQRR